MAELRVKNADIKVLCDVAPIQQELRQIEEQREFHRDAMFCISKHLTGMPTGKGTTHGIDDLLARLSETESRYREVMDEYLSALKAADRILNAIESVQMRSFVSLVYLQGKTKADVMSALNISDWAYRNGKEAVEKAERMRDVVWHERFYCDKNAQG